MQRLASTARLGLPYAVVAALLSAALVPQPVTPGVTMAAGLLLGGALAIIGGSTARGEHTATAGLLVASGLACSAWYAITSFMAVNPHVAWMGIIAQHNGTATWLMGFAWLLAALLLADRKSVRSVLFAVTVAGVVYAGAAYYEYISGGIGLTGDHARGFFENSVSFGQFLAMSIICSGAWLLAQRDLRFKVTGGVVTVALIAMLDLADSRTALIALAATAAVWFALSRRLPTTDRIERDYAIALTAAPITLSAVGIAAALGGLGESAASLMGRFSSGRDDIWKAAWARFSDSPIMGHGLEHFSTWTSWTLTSDAIESKATTDAHSIALSLGLGGGFVGLLLIVATFWLLNSVMLNSARTARSTAVSLVATLPLAMATAGSVGWIAPATMLVGAVAIGVVAGATREASPSAKPEWSGRVVRWGAIGIGVVAVALGLLGLRNVGLEMRHTGQSDPTVLAENHRIWPDPAFATASLQLLTPRIIQGDAASAQLAMSVIEASRADAAWRVELTGAQLITSQALEAADASRFPEFERVVAQGMRADPDSGLWYTFAAYEAVRLDLSEKARDYARKALEFEVPEQTRTELEAILR